MKPETGDWMKNYNELLLIAMGDDLSVLSLVDQAKGDDNLLALLKQFENSYQKLGEYITNTDKRGIEMRKSTAWVTQELAIMEDENYDYLPKKKKKRMYIHIGRVDMNILWQPIDYSNFSNPNWGYEEFDKAVENFDKAYTKSMKDIED